MMNSTVTRTNLNNVDNWIDYPENPADKISGEPMVKLNMIRTKGEVTNVHKAMLLTIEPSEFRYRFVGDESWIVLQGKVTITLEDGEVITMETGDIISVKGGRNSTWVVHEPFKKFVVVTSSTTEQ